MNKVADRLTVTCDTKSGGLILTYRNCRWDIFDLEGLYIEDIETGRITYINPRSWQTIEAYPKK